MIFLHQLHRALGDDDVDVLFRPELVIQNAQVLEHQNPLIINVAARS